eukprot:scaffold141628_cov214-Phaeocystis_antarctica.AAC.1
MAGHPDPRRLEPTARQGHARCNWCGRAVPFIHLESRRRGDLDASAGESPAGSLRNPDVRRRLAAQCHPHQSCGAQGHGRGPCSARRFSCTPRPIQASVAARCTRTRFPERQLRCGGTGTFLGQGTVRAFACSTQPSCTLVLSVRCVACTLSLTGPPALSRLSPLYRYTIPRLANLQLVAHVNETSKRELLTRAWFIINLSVHEGLAISFLEALACETPIVALVDPGGLVSSYGRYVGSFPGDGVEALPGLKQAVTELLSNQSLRRDLGMRGRRHVQTTHNEARFLDCFDRLLQRLCVPSTSAKCARLPLPNSDDSETTKRAVSFHRTSALDVSVVIPSFGRMQTLHHVLVAVLRSE